MPLVSDRWTEMGGGLGQSGKTCPVTLLALHWAWPQPVALSRMLYPMDANLSFLTTPTASPAVNGAMPAAVSGDAPTGSNSFAEVLTGEMFKAQRQAVAAPTLDTLGLQVLPLGSSLNIITSDAPLPDLASLAVFARSQGLDEAAVQALFGLPPASETAIKPSAVSLSDLEQLLSNGSATTGLAPRPHPTDPLPAPQTGLPVTDPLALAQASATLVSLQIGSPGLTSVTSATTPTQTPTAAEQTHLHFTQFSAEPLARVPATTLLAYEAFLFKAGEDSVEIVLLDPHLVGNLRNRYAWRGVDERQRLLVAYA